MTNLESIFKSWIGMTLFNFENPDSTIISCVQKWVRFYLANHAVDGI